MRLGILACAALLCGMASYGAEDTSTTTVTIRRGLNGYVYDTNGVNGVMHGNVHNGSGADDFFPNNRMDVYWGGTEDYRAFIKFPLNGFVTIPTGAVIDDIRVRFWVQRVNSAGADELVAVVFPTATWNNRVTYNTMPALDDTASMRVPILPLGSADPVTPATSWDVDLTSQASRVLGWIADDSTNFGICLKGDAHTFNWGLYTSSTVQTDDTLCPALMITYTMFETRFDARDPVNFGGVSPADGLDGATFTASANQFETLLTDVGIGAVNPGGGPIELTVTRRTGAGVGTYSGSDFPDLVPGSGIASATSAAGTPSKVSVALSKSGDFMGFGTIIYDLTVVATPGTQAQQTRTGTLTLTVNESGSGQAPGNFNLNAAALTKNVADLSWGTSTNADFYELNVYNPDTSLFMPTKTLTGTSWTVGGLVYGASYTWRVVAKNAAYETAALNNDGAFTVPADTWGPSVTATKPANGAADVSTTGKVEATLDEDYVAPDLQNAVTVVPTAGGPAVPGTVSKSGYKVIWQPSSALAENTEYRVTLDHTKIADGLGNALGKDETYTSGVSYQFTFTTQDAVTGLGKGDGCVPGGGGSVAAFAGMLAAFAALRRRR